jgi:hypothetical protein
MEVSILASPDQVHIASARLDARNEHGVSHCWQNTSQAITQTADELRLEPRARDSSCEGDVLAGAIEVERLPVAMSLRRLQQSCNPDEFSHANLHRHC